MNAYELADLMLDVTDCESSEYHQAGLMLRQQADEIGSLKSRLKQLAEEIGCYKIELELHKAMIQDLERGLESSLGLNKSQVERMAELEEQIKFLEEKCLMIEPLDDSHYPFRAILKKTD